MENRKKVLEEIKKSENGLTITKLVELTKLSRSSVRTCLSYLEGFQKVKFIEIGMAKVYSLK